jgi:omega-6 fatty acid desaturase (delta-12 desaturase)
MNRTELRELRAALEGYTKRSTAVACGLFMKDLGIYSAAVAGAVYFENPALKAVCAVIAGGVISAIFVIAHDAAHGAYTDSKLLNRLIGRIAFLPALHNYGLWQIAHNRQHHRVTNLKGRNSWSPLSKAEYDALPAWRRMVERLYRSPLGLGVYYLVERWWKDKFFPTERVVGKHQAVYWLDFALVLAYLAIFLGGLAIAGTRLPQTGPWGAVLWGFVVPFAVWNSAMGFTVYLQHTNLRVPWFDDLDQLLKLDGQHDVTVHVRFPRWYGHISHDIMEHPVHHLAPKIPLYHLKQAQDALAGLLGDRLISERFTLGGFLRTMARCKLYDYTNHRWLDFQGRPTCERTISDARMETAVAPAGSEPRAA